MKYGKRRGPGAVFVKIFRVIGRIVFFSIPIILLLVIISQASGVRYMCVLSSSMEPELPQGSLIVVVPRRAEEIRTGDNLTYFISGNYVTHRVVRIDRENKKIITKGIAGKLEDAPVPYGAVKGVQKLCFPGLGRLAEKLGTARGKIIILSAATAIFIAVIIADIILGRRRKTAANQIDLTAYAAENNIL